MNKSTEPDYSNYSRVELEQALASIDKTAFPERTALIEKSLEESKVEETDSPIGLGKNNRKVSIKAGRFGYLIFSIFLFYLSWDAIKTGEIVGYRGESYAEDAEPVAFYFRMIIVLGLGCICALTSFYYWLQKDET
jgi:hypothetical protein